MGNPISNRVFWGTGLPGKTAIHIQQVLLEGLVSPERAQGDLVQRG